jgi:divalent metal cation (Fe/Co/Zn/Cd) transporter
MTTTMTRLTQRARQLALLTIGWNCLEGGIAVATGIAAGSVALLGFGVDSLIEVVGAAIVFWRLTQDEGAERRAALFVGLTYVALALYIVLDAARTLIGHEHPHASSLGLAVSLAALLIMPALAVSKRSVAHRLGSASLLAEANESLVCAGLALATVAGLLLNQLAGWWWADPVAALAMLPIIVKEGWHILTTRDLC